MASTPSDDGSANPATRIRRHPERASYGFAEAAAVFDATVISHVGVVRDGSPVVLPMTHGRSGDVLYLHGSTGAGLLRPSKRPDRACVTATVVDGVVFAGAAFSHSFNYRSAVVTGPVQALTDPGEKTEALRCIVEHLAPGRWDDARQPSESELRETAVLEIKIESWTAKSRTGPPVDDTAPDASKNVWTGVIPTAWTAVGDPIAKDEASQTALPSYLKAWPGNRPGGAPSA